MCARDVDDFVLNSSRDAPVVGLELASPEWTPAFSIMFRDDEGFTCPFWARRSIRFLGVLERISRR